jgi:hypothetical protein
MRPPRPGMVNDVFVGEVEVFTAIT